MNPIEPPGKLRDPMNLRTVLLERAEKVQLYGDFAPGAIEGGRRVRRRRVVVTAIAGALVVAIPLGLSSRGVDRRVPVTPASGPAMVTEAPPSPRTATVRVSAAEGDIPLPYLKAGVLHLHGRTVRLPVGTHARVRFFAALGNGGVVYQVAGPDPSTPDRDAGPLTFLDRDGKVVSEHEGIAQADTDGPGGLVSGAEANGDYVVLDGAGALVRRLLRQDYGRTTSGAGVLGDHLVANLAGEENPVWVGSLDTGRSAYIADTYRVGSSVASGAGLAVHDGLSLVVQGLAKPLARDYPCKALVNYVSGERLRTWCDDRRPLGFSPDGAWMYGEYTNSPGVWAARTDDGAPLLEIRADAATTDVLTGELPAPSPDGTALIVVVTDGLQTVANSCAIATGECRVMSDGLDSVATGPLSLPDNWGRQEIGKVRPPTTMP